MKIGRVIKKIRIEKNIRQGDLARALNITQAYLSQIENDVRTPSTTLLNVIGKELDIPSPVIFYLGIEETDVPLKNREAYNQLSKTIESLVKSVFY